MKDLQLSGESWQGDGEEYWVEASEESASTSPPPDGERPSWWRRFFGLE